MDDEAAAPSLVDTGERMVPEYHSGVLIYAEHVTRYRGALPVVSGRVVLDIACGSGYGSSILAEQAAHVYGVDVDPDAVAYAQAHFGAPNVEFSVGDAVAIPLPDDSVDVVVTFETLEHIADQRAFMHEIKRVLRPDGIALISTPNDKEFAEGNHFHLHEFEYDELLELVGEFYGHVDEYFQATWKYVALGRESAFTAEGPMDIPTENLAPLVRDQFLYFYLACSDRPIDRFVQPVAAVGAHWSDRAQATHDATVQGQLDHLQRLVDELTTRIHDTEQQRDAVQRDLDTIRSSRVWRYSEPLRSATREVRRRRAAADR